MLLQLHEDIFVVLNSLLHPQEVLRLAETSHEIYKVQREFIPYALAKLRLERPRPLNHVHKLFEMLEKINEFIEIQNMNLYYFSKKDKLKYAHIPQILKERNRYQFAWNEVEISSLHSPIYFNYYKHLFFFFHDAQKKILIYSKKKCMLSMFLKNPYVQDWLCPEPLFINYN